MELIYLYIGDIGRNIYNQGINFGNSFQISYDAESRQLSIRPSGNKSVVSYGKNIQSVDLIVGKNGSGKSSIMQLLGQTINTREKLFPLSLKQKVPGENQTKAEINTPRWFALYHMKENWFVLEGCDSSMHVFLDGISDKLLSVYSVSFIYDIESQRPVKSTRDLADNKGWSQDQMFYLSYFAPNRIGWLGNLASEKTDPYKNGFFLRYCPQHNDLVSIEKYLYDVTHLNQKEDFSKLPKMGFESRVKIYCQNHLLTSPGIEKERDDFEFKLYGGKRRLCTTDTTLGVAKDPVFSYQKDMAIIYLENLIFKLKERIDRTNEQFGRAAGEDLLQKTEYCLNSEVSYETLKDYLMGQIIALERSPEVNTEYCIAQRIVEGIEKIPSGLFVNSEKLEIKLSQMENNFLETLMSGFDMNRTDEGVVIASSAFNHEDLIQAEFYGLSSGEAFMIDLFASVYSGIRFFENNRSDCPEGSTCILLLDEPDAGFHPEWTRRFINDLTETLSSDLFKRYNYQIIISTHSPLMLTDVPNKNIRCLNVKNGLTEIKSPNYGFLSRIDDLLIDDFFSESIFGAFAEKYVNRIIDDIKAFEEAVTGAQIPKEKIDDVRERIQAISNEQIYSSLMNRLNRVIRKNSRWQV